MSGKKQSVDMIYPKMQRVISAGELDQAKEFMKKERDMSR